MTFRLLHTADLHLDAPFVGAGMTPHSVTRRLARAGVETLDRLVELAIDLDVDGLVVSGGLVPPSPLPTTLARVGAALAALDAAGITTVVVGHPGEPLDQLVGEAGLPASVTLVGPGPLRSVPIRRAGGGGDSEAAGSDAAGGDGDGEVLVEIWAGSGLDGLAELAQLDEAGAHQPDGAAAAASSSAPVRIAACPLPPPRADGPVPPPLDRASFVCWALGGRWPATLARLDANGAWVAMAGTPQPHGFTEPGVMAGAVLIEGDPAGTGLAEAPSWHPVAAVDPATVSVSLAEVADLDQLAGKLRDAARGLVTARTAPLVVARAVVEGTGPLRLALVDPAVRAWLLDGLRADAARADDPDRIWWADLILAALAPAAAEPLIRTDRLAEATVRIGGVARSTPPDDVLDRAWDEVGERVGVGSPPPPTWPGVLREATSVVFDLVEGGRTCV